MMRPGYVSPEMWKSAAEANARTAQEAAQRRRMSPDDRRVEINRLAAQIAADKGGRVTTPYRGGDTRIGVRCAAGHRWQVTPHDLLCGNTWCGECHRASLRKNIDLRLAVKLLAISDSLSGGRRDVRGQRQLSAKPAR